MEAWYLLPTCHAVLCRKLHVLLMRRESREISLFHAALLLLWPLLGAVGQVLQGLYARPDCARQLSRLSLGIVPAGSGNGLAKTVRAKKNKLLDYLFYVFFVI